MERQIHSLLVSRLHEAHTLPPLEEAFRNSLGIEFGKQVGWQLNWVFSDQPFIEALFPPAVGTNTIGRASTLFAEAFQNIRLTPLGKTIDNALSAQDQDITDDQDCDRGVALRAEKELDLAVSVYGYSIFGHVCLICDWPVSTLTDDAGRLHREDGPAVSFADGFKVFAWHGALVDEEILLHPESITIIRLEQEKNVESRRVMIERYGHESYLEESGASLVDSDPLGKLYRKEIPGDEPLVMVEVINSTPEPDGTTRTYFLRVPPTIETAREAVAWTFGMEHSEYEPTLET